MSDKNFDGQTVNIRNRVAVTGTGKNQHIKKGQVLKMLPFVAEKLVESGAVTMGGNEPQGVTFSGSGEPAKVSNTNTAAPITPQGTPVVPSGVQAAAPVMPNITK